MQSRMEKYYKKTESQKRSDLNEDLYKSIYDMPEYSNIEGIANIDKPNEVDIIKIRELLKSRENAAEEVDYRRVTRETKPKEQEEPVILDVEKNYDIRDILTKAKDERTTDDQKYYSIKEQELEFLSSIRKKSNSHREEINEDELKELIHTITNTSMLNKLGDGELSLNILDNLKSQGNTMVSDSPSIKALLQEEKKEVVSEDNNNVDKSFYTSSLNFNAEDFDELKDINVTLKKNNILIKVLLVVLTVVVLVIGVMVLNNYVDIF